MIGEPGRTGTEEGAPPQMREWLIEYYVESSTMEMTQCLTILRGRTVEEAQQRLYSELRESFPLDFKIEVTVTRMIPIDIDTDQGLFEIDGVYQP